MLKTLFFLLCITLIGVSCLKEGDKSCAFPILSITAPLSEQDSIEAYLDSNNIDAVQHPAGFYYKVVNPGTGTDTMTLCSEVYIDAVGRLKSGKIFVTGEQYFVLGGLPIEGLKKGLPLIKKDGEIKLFIPPSLGLGPNDFKNDSNVVVVPGNSMLIYDVKLRDYSKGY